MKMRKTCITLILSAIIILSGICLGLNPVSQVQTEYLRIHIRANSNLEQDQSLKYLVKDAIVSYLTPYIAQCDTKEKAKTLLSSRLNSIEQVADKVIASSGFSYKSSASVTREKFPTRVYGELQLDAGEYDALIIRLGSGTGDNWWCVVYPPLCFTGEKTNVIYKSKILEIISAFFKKESMDK